MKKKIISLIIMIIFIIYYMLKTNGIISIIIYNESITRICQPLIIIPILIYVSNSKPQKLKFYAFILCTISLLYLLFSLFLMIAGGKEKVIQSYKIDNNNSLESVYYRDIKEITEPIEIIYKHKIIGPIYCQERIDTIYTDNIYSSKETFIKEYPLENFYANIKDYNLGICGKKLVRTTYEKEKYYQDLKDNIHEDISKYIKINGPYCSVGSASYTIDEETLMVQAGIDKKKFLDMDGKSYCKVKVNVRCVAENEHDFDTYLKCKNYEDKEYKKQ